MFKKQFLIYLILCFCFTLKAFNQNYFDHLEKKQPRHGTVHVYQDYKIKKVTLLYSDYKSDTKGFRGYRINIFSDSGHGSKEEAIDARAKFINRFSDVEVIIKYDSPFWRVYVGEFLIKSDARKFLGKIMYLFPNAYIVPYYFNLPNEEDNQ